MTPSGVDAQIVREWLAHAEDDALNARSVLKHRDGTPAQVCFLAQQMIEKLLKAGLVHFQGDAPLVHDLPYLAKALQTGVPKILTSHESDLKEISEYYVTTRYPAHVPLERFTWDMAERAFATAESIAAVIQKALNIT